MPLASICVVMRSRGPPEAAATTGQPHAIASRRTMPKLSPEMDGREDEDRRLLHPTRDVALRKVAWEQDSRADSLCFGFAPQR